MNIHSFTRHLPRPMVIYSKYLLQGFNRFVHSRNIIESNYEYDIIKNAAKHTFFGYYDILPFNNISDEILYETVSMKDNVANVILENTKTKQTKQITKSYAWNWQQGSRLRWMPNNKREIVFNDYDGKRYYCRIIDLDNEKETQIDQPLYDISPDGLYGLSLNFERLGVMRPGYGYTCRKYICNEDQLGKEGIDIVDIKQNKSNRIITYEDIANALGLNLDSYANNYLNHISFSPSGQKFLFFWLTVENDWHKAFLLVYDFKSAKLDVLENNDKVSHYVWIDDDTIICTAIDSQKQCRYYKYSITLKTKDVISPDTLKRDGHPSYVSKGVLLTDTYPDDSGYQHLYLVDISRNKAKKILSVYNNSLICGERRTDLHPRFDRNKNYVCIDANPEHYREMIIIKNVIPNV